MSAAARLADGIKALGLDIDAATQQRLLAYGGLLMKWNKVYNLTAIRDEQALIDLHLLDSLTVLPYVTMDRIADIGAGGGLPGIPLAICRPELEVALVETVGKKASFLQQAKIELKLDRVSVHNTRVEQLQVERSFPAIVSRAFSSLADFVSLTDHLLAPGGHWLAMKGVDPLAEVAALPAGVEVLRTHHLQVPGLTAERNLLVLGRR
ncbi:16S rRNA (guanine(527)-N(7))-methyltransferase RsmG [Uliginosibacterium sp. H1]|uniref:16S rRNA (guanine(527)-N(7))-methyltransferase RsmG n=1 Tax=Uliginosibacterium sp. H1 TaxID=3114757 RepID=UPI002E17ED1F|nr:16S rRNA (guanine(527)-N(7))-methyltransferase RsmG [Uliginosibacterium sp. H1]